MNPNRKSHQKKTAVNWAVFLAICLFFTGELLDYPNPALDEGRALDLPGTAAGKQRIPAGIFGLGRLLDIPVFVMDFYG